MTTKSWPYRAAARSRPTSTPPSFYQARLQRRAGLGLLPLGGSGAGPSAGRRTCAVGEDRHRGRQRCLQRVALDHQHRRLGGVAGLGRSEPAANFSHVLSVRYQRTTSPSWPHTWMPACRIWPTSMRRTPATVRMGLSKRAHLRMCSSSTT
jgi:hypothetical protein